MIARRDTTSAREHAEHRIVGDGGKRRRGRHQRERRALAQAQQACGLVDLGAGQHHRVDRAAARALRGCSAGVAWICARRSGEALSSVQRLPSARHGEARLRARRARADRRPRPAGTRRNYNSIAESRRPPPHRARWRSVPSRREAEARSEFGRQIAVDLEADADLDEGRGGPGHGVSSDVVRSEPNAKRPVRCLKGRCGFQPGASARRCPLQRLPAIPCPCRFP